MTLIPPVSLGTTGKALRTPSWSPPNNVPLMFELHFRDEAKTEWPHDRSAKRSTDGSYIRFAKQCLRELGINYKGESVARASEHARREQRRQKPELRSFDERVDEWIEVGSWLGTGKKKKHGEQHHAKSLCGRYCEPILTDR